MALSDLGLWIRHPPWQEFWEGVGVSPVRAGTVVATAAF